MVLYIETVFLENFLPNTFLLFLSSFFTKKRTFLRAVSGGSAGGIYSVFVLYYPLLSAFYFRIAMGILMCIICFGTTKQLPKGILSFFTLTFLLGGIAFGMMYLFENNTHSRISFTLLCASGIVFLMLISFLRRQRPAPVTEQLTLEMRLGEQTLIFHGEYDSGTAIRDHHGNGVILADRDFLKKNLSEELFADIQKCQNSKTVKTRIFHIRTASGASTLVGFLPEELTVLSQDTPRRLRAYILIAEHINLNGSPAIYGQGLKMEEIT